jgi:2-C-methyl-D-erythritol 4-phosphate cytidylyltransferase
LPRDVGVILVAGGRGQRLGGAVAKQFQSVAGQPMLLRALRPFASHPDVCQVAVVVPAAVLVAPPEWLARLAGDMVTLAAGGAERMDSVELGLARLRPECSIVLSHDAARPFVSRETIDAVVSRARQGESAIAARPVSDTLKAAKAEDGNHLIAGTISREGVWRAQTPQGFPRRVLEEAFVTAHQSGLRGTDEAALVEQTGERIHLVPDTVWNLKVTSADDLQLAELIARQRDQ